MELCYTVEHRDFSKDPGRKCRYFLIVSISSLEQTMGEDLARENERLKQKSIVSEDAEPSSAALQVALAELQSGSLL